MSLATRLVVLLLSAAFSSLLASQSLARFDTFHNRTYDLALYARQAWGLAHGSYWDPVVDVHFLGTHISLILAPLGFLGRYLGVVPVLLVTQALAIGLAALPLAQLGARRFGDLGALCAATAWFAYPNISQVASYEFHPGTVAVLPLACALDAMSGRRALGFLGSCLAVLLCRADLALATTLLALAACSLSAGQPGFRRAAVGVLLGSLAYLALQYTVIRPNFWAARTSLDLHFARWGGSPVGMVRALFSNPELVFEHFRVAKRLMYLPMILCPLGFLPLFAPRYALGALPFVAINLISIFPTTVELYSHYLTPAVPMLIAAALEGLVVVCARIRLRGLDHYGLAALLVLSVLADVYRGNYPWSAGFDQAAFTRDAFSAQGERIVAKIPREASVQAPDALLPHLIARERVYRAPPPERDCELVVLDASHRGRYAGREDLLRTVEEPQMRSWLARRDYGLVHAEPDYLVFERGRDAREAVAARYLSGLPAAVFGYGTPLTRCLTVVSAWLDPQGLELELSVHGPCPADLALRFDMANGASRVDLLFDGLLSPAQLRDERVFSWHTLTAAERHAITAHGLSLGAVGANGAPPEYGDPVQQPIAVIH